MAGRPAVGGIPAGLLPVLPSGNAAGGAAPGGSAGDAAAPMQLAIIHLCIALISVRIEQLASSERKAFFSTLGSLLEKSTEVSVLQAVSRLVVMWIKGLPMEIESTKEIDLDASSSQADEKSSSPAAAKPAGPSAPPTTVPPSSALALTAGLTPASCHLSTKEKILFLLKMTRFDKVNRLTSSSPCMLQGDIKRLIS